MRLPIAAHSCHNRYMSTTTQSAEPTTLADFIRQGRKRKGLSRSRLGALTDTSLSSLNRLELQGAIPLAPSLFRIADVLDLDRQTLEVLVLRAAEEGGVPAEDAAADD